MHEFVHLHLHTQYSLLDGAIRLKEMIPRLQEFGMTSVAVTDHGNMFGAVDFYKRAKKAGIKPILGVEAYVAENSRHERKRGAFHLILLAKNATGYANLRKLVSMAYLEGFYYHPRMDLELIKAHNEGIIALSACLGGQIAQSIMKGRVDHARQLAQTYRDTFEPGAFYLEVQPNGLSEQATVNTLYRQFSKEYGIPLCATNDCHYLERHNARAHDVLMSVQMGKTLDDPTRMRHPTDAYWLKPASEMWKDFGDDFPDALEATVRIAEQCNVELDLGNVYLPNYQVPEDHDIETFLVHRAQTGLNERFDEFKLIDKDVDRTLYQRRLDEELDIIKSMGFPGYFLIVEDFINWAKDQDIAVGPGRGSGAGSLAAYALRITDIDPIPYGLLFERFLNPERVSMPDFDIDFCMNRRNEVIDYVTHKYGAENVGQIATFGSLKAKGVIKDVGRALGMSYGETDRLSKMVPDVLNITLDQALEQEPRLRKLYDDEDQIRDLLDVARSLEGLHRQVGMHAAGIVIGDKPLWEYCPVFKGQNGELVTQFAKDEVEEAGLVKFDFLGLKTLTVVDDAVRMVNRNRAPGTPPLDIRAIPLVDQAVYDLVSDADTDGVFQLESSGFQELLKKLKPDKFEDIVAAVALYRPGPLNSGMLDDFIARKHGRQAISYPHPLLAGVLEETYGVIVYQEQVMQIAQKLAGFSLGGADLLRRAMGKKKADVMAAQREVFAKGAADRGIEPKKATEIFDLMEKFAEYGFNKSHSAAYALITYQTAYLKTHHRVEFTAALLTSDRDVTDKVTKTIRNARARGIEVLPPSVNESSMDFDAVDGRIVFGLAGVKGVGTTAVEGILEARDAGGPFKDAFDFCERVDLRRVNKKTVEQLIKSGALDNCNEPRARLFEGLDILIERAQSAQRDRASGQGNLFGLLLGGGDQGVTDNEFPPEIREIEEWSERELLANEKSSLGFYVSGHPLDRFADEIERYVTATVDRLTKLENHATVKLAGVVTALRVRPFRSGDGRMGIITFEDQTGTVELIAMGDELDRHEELLNSDEPMLITGKLRLEFEEGRANVSVRLGHGGRRGQRNAAPDPGSEPVAIALSELRASRARGWQVEVDATAATPQRLTELAQLLRTATEDGRCATYMKLVTDDQCEVILSLGKFRVTPNDDLHHQVRRVFGGECQIRTL